LAATGDQRQDETVHLLKHLLAIELWRGGLTQSQIKARLGLGSGTVTEMLKGVSREVQTRDKADG
jgi:Mn-dependent DtxR family transcriptional regulator